MLPTNEGTRPQEEAARPRQTSILVVDDSHLSCKLATKALGRADYRAEVGSAGKTPVVLSRDCWKYVVPRRKMRENPAAQRSSFNILYNVMSTKYGIGIGWRMRRLLFFPRPHLRRNCPANSDVATLKRHRCSSNWPKAAPSQREAKHSIMPSLITGVWPPEVH